VTPERFKDLVQLYALGALDAAERAEVETFLASPACDAACQRALAEAMATAHLLTRELPPVPPSAEVWQKIEARLDLAKTRDQAVPIEARRRSRLATAVAVAGWVAAAALLLLWLRERSQVGQLATRTLAAEKRVRTFEGQIQDVEGRTVTAHRERDACLRRLETLETGIEHRDAAIALLELPGTQLFALKPEPGEKTQANAIVHTGLKRAYIAATGLTPQAGKDYELWVVRGKQVLAAGLVKSDAQGRALVRVDYEPLTGELPEKLIVTLEPAGGGPVARGPAVLSGTL
jgi:anti-sigma-K factor RskA